MILKQKFLKIFEKFLPLFRYTKTTLLVYYLERLFNFMKNIETEITFDNNIKMYLDLNDFVQRIIYLNGYYEKNETEIWKKIVKNKKVIFDIGMNVGYYSLLASKRVEVNVGKIYGFEPVSRTFERAKLNVNLNNYNNIVLNNLAISNKVGSIDINLGNDENWGMSSIKINNQISGLIQKAKCDTIDNYIKNLDINQIDVIKIDVEGAEPFVIDGMLNTLNRFSPIILIELLKENLNEPGKEINDIYGLFKSLGFEPYKIISSTSIKKIYSPISIHGLILFKKNSNVLEGIKIL